MKDKLYNTRLTPKDDTWIRFLNSLLIVFWRNWRIKKLITIEKKTVNKNWISNSHLWSLILCTTTNPVSPKDQFYFDTDYNFCKKMDPEPTQK